MPERRAQKYDLHFPIHNNKNNKIIKKKNEIFNKKNISILFNSPDRTVTTHFDTTPLTSSYLIAFIVSDFQFKENSRNNKFRHRVYATPKDFQAGEFAVIEGEKILNAIANYLHVPFSLPKMDQAAIPDFNAGGNSMQYSIKSNCFS